MIYLCANKILHISGWLCIQYIYNILRYIGLESKISEEVNRDTLAII